VKPALPSRRIVLACAALALSTAAPVVAASGETVAGRWRLVEQTFGRGKAELVGGPPALHLEFSRVAGAVAGKVWTSGREAHAVEWPSLFADHEPAPVRVVERAGSESGDRVLARYEARDPADAQATLEITEDYRLVEDGAALVGTVTVRLRHDGRDAGEYVLRRRFERER